MTTMPRTAAHETHEVINQSEPFVDVNVFDSDVALQEAVVREGGGWGVDRMRDFGQVAGSAEADEHRAAGAAQHSRSSTSTTASATASTRSNTTRPCTGCCGSASSARSTRSHGATRSRARTWCATGSSI